MRRGALRRALTIVVGLALAGVQSAWAEEAVTAPPDPTSEEICRLIETNADARSIPPGFFARLIWQESRFDRHAVSPKGALGIAQFMPGTALERALDDPFDIPTALAASAAFLEELSAGLGNLGLAAAAYNAGPNRVRRWIDGHAVLPLETQRFVRAITGLEAEDWQASDVEVDFALGVEQPFLESCVRMAALSAPASPSSAFEGSTRILPWGAQVAAHFSRNSAISTFDRLAQRYQRVLGEHEPSIIRHRAPARGNRALYAIRIGAETRAAAEAFCKDLRALGGPCVVMKN
jgi:hypothetical protein